jgi:hypothetical protein
MTKTIDGKSYYERTPAEWKVLPVVECACGQKFYQQVEGVADCDDCISTDDSRWPAYSALTRGRK